MIDTNSAWTRRKLLRTGALTAGGLTVGGATLSASAAAENAETFTFHDTTLLPSGGTCFSENVRLDARGHIVLQATSDGGHYHVHLQVHGDAIGVESETTYRFNETVSEVYPKDTESFHIRLTSLIVSRGSDPNLFIELHFHTTVNANGEVTAVKMEPISFECRG